MVGWHHGVNGHEFEQALGDGDGQRGLGCKESGRTEGLNSNNLCSLIQSCHFVKKVLHVMFLK